MHYEVSQMRGKVFSTVSLVRVTAMLSLYQLEYWGCTHCQRMVNSILAVELMLSSVCGTAILWIKSRNRPMKWSAGRNQGPCLYRKHNLSKDWWQNTVQKLWSSTWRTWLSSWEKLMYWGKQDYELSKISQWFVRDADSFVSPLPLSQFPLQQLYSSKGWLSGIWILS